MKRYHTMEMGSELHIKSPKCLPKDACHLKGTTALLGATTTV